MRSLIECTVAIRLFPTYVIFMILTPNTAYETFFIVSGGEDEDLPANGSLRQATIDMIAQEENEKKSVSEPVEHNEKSVSEPGVQATNEEVYFENDMLFYKGNWLIVGDWITAVHTIRSMYGRIYHLDSKELWLKCAAGHKTKLIIDSLQKSDYSIEI